ncbi:hypothetical protein ACFLSJ_08210 [Verrucomicrobiota bacterium]
MNYDEWFDTDENKALLAICARKLIGNIGIGAIIWGVINIAIGVIAMIDTVINVGVLILGVVMLATGVRARKSPTLGVLLTQTIVSAVLFVWNLGMSILNLIVMGAFTPQGLVFPLIIAIVFAGYYRKLGHLREVIASVEPEKIKATKDMCKTLVKKKLKDEPLIVQTTNRRCRAQLLTDRTFFIQRDLMRAFVAPKDAVHGAVAKPDAKSWKLQFMHPLGKLTYQFDRKDSDKLRNWLSSESAATGE